MKNKFLLISIGVSMMILSTAFLIRSISPANASPTPDKFISEGTNSVGKYQMTLTFSVFSDGSTATRALVWDTETGKSVYYRNDTNGWVKQDFQLPASPLQ
jgi:hypothetical protein